MTGSAADHESRERPGSRVRRTCANAMAITIPRCKMAGYFPRLCPEGTEHPVQRASAAANRDPRYRAERRISRTTSRPTVTIRDMDRRWPCADWRRHAERSGASVSMAETPQRKGMRQPALTVSVVPAFMANVAKPLESRLPAGRPASAAWPLNPEGRWSALAAAAGWPAEPGCLRI